MRGWERSESSKADSFKDEHCQRTPWNLGFWNAQSLEGTTHPRACFVPLDNSLEAGRPSMASTDV
jgi:hypothetical protein